MSKHLIHERRLKKLLLEEIADSQKRIDYGLKPEIWNPRVLEIIELGKKLTNKPPVEGSNK